MMARETGIPFDVLVTAGPELKQALIDEWMECQRVIHDAMPKPKR